MYLSAVLVKHNQIHIIYIIIPQQLEFIDYSDPNYQLDLGDTDELFSADEQDSPDAELLEQMREERRCKNDEYQFETYFKEILKNGGTFKGEWTVYRTSTFTSEKQGQHDENGFPLLIQDENIMKVVSRAKKIPLLAHLDGIGPIALTAIVHEERLATEQDWLDEMGDDDRILQQSNSLETNAVQSNDDKTDKTVKDCILNTRYWPEELFPSDFRGPNGIMCVGNAYTICNTTPLSDTTDGLVGPFSQLCTELGITYKRMKYRMKLDYRIKDFEKTGNAPLPLHLFSLIICREALERWPRYNMDSFVDKETSIDEVNVDDATTRFLFGPMGSPGGLYDPPPVGTDAQSSQYMLIDLEGSASILFPFMIDQDPLTHGSDATWVTSLDWTPGRFRYQVDRKFFGGTNVRGLKTLELSEVEAEQSEQWRPRDGGIDMRQ